MLRPRSVNFRQDFRNLSRKTVPLNDKDASFYCRLYIVQYVRSGTNILLLQLWGKPNLETSMIFDKLSTPVILAVTYIRSNFIKTSLWILKMPSINSNYPYDGCQASCKKTMRIKRFFQERIYFPSVFRIFDILVRIRIRGSVPLSNESGSSTGSFSFRR